MSSETTPDHKNKNEVVVNPLRNPDEVLTAVLSGDFKKWSNEGAVILLTASEIKLAAMLLAEIFREGISGTVPFFMVTVLISILSSETAIQIEPSAEVATFAGILAVALITTMVHKLIKKVDKYRNEQRSEHLHDLLSIFLESKDSNIAEHVQEAEKLDEKIKPNKLNTALTSSFELVRDTSFTAIAFFLVVFYALAITKRPDQSLDFGFMAQQLLVPAMLWLISAGSVHNLIRQRNLRIRKFFAGHMPKTQELNTQRLELEKADDTEAPVEVTEEELEEHQGN